MQIAEIVTEAKKSVPKKQLVPSTSDVDQKSIKKLAGQIRTNCSWYLEIFKKQNKYLYRGRWNSDELAFQSKPPQKRNPLDSDREATKLYDQMASMLGIKALRSNSIFVTSDPELAADFGQVYYVFPFNSCAFTWSRNLGDTVLRYGSLDLFVEDHSLKIMRVLDSEYNKLRGISRAKMPPEKLAYFKILEKMQLVFEYNEYPSSNPKQTAKKIREVMPKSPLIALLEKPIEYDAQKFQKAYKLASESVGFASPEQSLTAALKSKNEILIQGPYIAVKKTLWPHIKDLL
jgi:hypothetical protein